jgi:tetrahydromethanopterin S-methyltransferase subunit F
VTLHSTAVTAMTDGNGYATFNNVSPGGHHVTYAAGSKNYDQQIFVLNNVTTESGAQTAATQAFSVVYTNYAQGLMTGLVWAGVLIAIVILLLLGAFGIRSRKPRFPMLTTSNTAPVTVGTNQSSSNSLLNSIRGLNKPTPGNTVAPGSNQSSPEASHNSDVHSGTGGM